MKLLKLNLIIFSCLLFSDDFFLATSRWLYGVPWIDTHLFGATKYMKLIHFCPGQCGNLGRCDSVPQVRRVADEGSPVPCPISISDLCAWIFEGLRLCGSVYGTGLSRGMVRWWSSRILSLGHVGGSPSGWLVGSVLVPLIAEHPQVTKERMNSVAALTWAGECLLD